MRLVTRDSVYIQLGWVYWCFTSHATIFQSYMWRHRCAGGLKKKLGRAPEGIDISQGSLTCPSYTDTGPPFSYGDSDIPPHLVAFYDTLGIRRTYCWLKPPPSSRGIYIQGYNTNSCHAYKHSTDRRGKRHCLCHICICYIYEDFFLWKTS